MPKVNPYLVLIIAVLGVSVSAIFVKFTTAPPEVTAFYRLLFTFLLSIPMIAGTKKYHWKKITPRHLGLIFLSALFLALHFVTWFASLSYTSVATSTVLVNTQPFFVILFGFLILRQPISKNGLWSVALAVFGTIVLSWHDLSVGGDSLFGDFLAILGAIFIAVNYLLSSYLRTDLDTIPYTTLLYGFCTIILAATVAINGQSFVGYQLQDYAVFLGLALFCTILGHTLFSWCMKYLSPSAVSLSVLGEPVIAALVAYLLLGEQLYLAQILGGLIVLLAIYGYLKDDQQSKTMENA